MTLHRHSHFTEPCEDNTDPEIHVPSSLEREKCPVCGEEAEWFYIDDWGSVVGCDKCIHERYVGEC